MNIFNGFFGRYFQSRSDWKPPSFWPISWWQQGYRTPGRDANAAVEACVGAISQTIAMMPISHWRENSRGGAERVTTSAASRVLRRPNNYQTKADFFLNLIRAELLTGNGYALAQRNDRSEIFALHLTRPHSLYPFISPEDGSIFYQFAEVPVGHDFTPVIEDLFPARDVLHIRMHTPNTPLVGESPITAAATAIESGNAISKAMSAFHQNMSRPSGYLKIPGKLDAVTAESLRTEWNAAYQGVSSGRVAVLQGGVEWETLSMSAVDAALIESYKLSVADVARVYRVPLAIIGDNTSTYNNTEVLMKFWLATGLGYVLEHVELALDELFGLSEREGEWIAFDTDYLQRADFTARIDGLVKGVQGAIFTPNEARAREGLPSVEHGDEPRVQAQVVPLSFASIPPSAPAATVVKEEAPPPPVEEEEEDEDELTVEQMSARYEELCL